MQLLAAGYSEGVDGPDVPLVTNLPWEHHNPRQALRVVAVDRPAIDPLQGGV